MKYAVNLPSNMTTPTISDRRIAKRMSRICFARVSWAEESAPAGVPSGIGALIRVDSLIIPYIGRKPCDWAHGSASEFPVSCDHGSELHLSAAPRGTCRVPDPSETRASATAYPAHAVNWLQIFPQTKLVVSEARKWHRLHTRGTVKDEHPGEHRVAPVGTQPQDTNVSQPITKELAGGVAGRVTSRE